MRPHTMDRICCPACSGRFHLIIEEKLEEEVVQGLLECRECKRCYKITDGLPNLIFPETLEESDRQQQIWHDQHARKYDRGNREWMLSLGIWEFALWENRARRLPINSLELRKNATVLETGTGTGSSLPAIASQIGEEGRLDGCDISSGMLEVARRKMEAKGFRAELIQANASYLPYRTATFDAVLHIGGLNTFADKKRAIEEMHRVAKMGAKIVICDEGLAPGKKKTWMGRWILKRDKKGRFTLKPPIELVPSEVEDLKVSWVWNDIFWVIGFRKKVFPH